MRLLSLKKLPLIISYIMLGVSLLVMLGWVLRIDSLLSIIPEAPTMKFNTALLFFLSGFILLCPYFFNKSEQPISLGLASFISLLASITLLSNFVHISFDVDNLIVQDYLSTKNLGKMSIATSVCFILLGMGKIYQIKGGYFLKQKASIIFNIIALVSLISIISYLIGIPAKERFGMFETMAINTSILFLLAAYGFALKYPNIGFIKVIHSNLLGSKLLQKALPFLVLIPIVIGMGFMHLQNLGFKNIGFGVVAAVVTFEAIGIIYVAIIAKQINDSDLISHQLQYSLQKINNDLTYFKTALDASTIVAITDRRGVITYVNDKFCEISQYDRSELIGQTHGIINASYHDKAFFQDLWRTIGSGKIWKGEIKNKAKDGSYYWVLTSIVPFINKEGKIYQYLAIRQDITEKKESEELLASHYVKELERKNKELEQFTYIASHDLQEPLRTIQNFVEIIEEDCVANEDDEVHQHLKFISSASKRMSNLIKGLLDYSLIGRTTVLEPIDFNDLINDVSKDLQLTIRETKTEIITQELPKMRGYKSEMGALFQNLISNAIKFCPTDRNPIIEIGAKQDKHFYEFYVKDNGIGIEQKYLEKIFVIFQRLHNQKQVAGTGIGLAHCKKIVELHGGKIWVKSTPDKGTTFYFTISNHLEDIA